MFVTQSKKGSTFLNILILFTIVVVACVVATSLVKLVPDEKNPGSYKNTLALGRKKSKKPTPGTTV